MSRPDGLLEQGYLYLRALACIRTTKGHSDSGHEGYREYESKEPGVVIKKVLFKPVQGQDLYVAVEQASKQATHKEWFVIVTDFKTLLAKDMSGKGYAAGDAV